ncbi:MAG: ribosome-associated translation inhibitor RaiA [Armatimonadota bacterium]|nr:ribosome-associated translation inhibitor RaiA [Armatimonadota bacterium]
MRVTVRGKNMEVTEDLKSYAEKKLRKLEKYFDHIHDVQIVQSIERQWHVVEVTLQGDGLLLRGEERSPDMYASIDQVLEKLERQLQKFRGRRIFHPRSTTAHLREQAEEAASTARAEEAEEAEESDSPLESIRIVRTKRFPIKPMPPEEAAMQMELLGHDFFVFANAETEQVNVLYRRKEGGYGLIEPEV